jgi:hypothetical protein
MPTLPTEPITSASASLAQAWPESGTNAEEALDESGGACTGGNFLGCSLRVKQHGAILGMQMRCNRTRVQHSIIPGRRPRG